MEKLANIKADVVIVGAGISGLFTALNLDKRFKIIIIERQSFPPRKLCAGIMGDPAYYFIKDFKPPDTIFHIPRQLKMKIIDEDNHIDYINKDDYLNLCRRKFYNWMRSLLPENLEIFDSTKLIKIEHSTPELLIHTQGQYNAVIKTKYLVGADGFFSSVRKALCLAKPNYIHSIQYLMESVQPLTHIEMIFNRNLVKKYYMWTVPKEKNILIGMMIEKDNYRQILEYAKKKYSLTGTIIKKGSHPITCIKATDECSTGRGCILLTGEAAGFVRPTSGEGLTFAFKSGLFAAQAIMNSPVNPYKTYNELCSVIFNELNEDIALYSVFYGDIEKRKAIFQSR